MSNAIRPPPSSNLLPQGCDLPTYLGDETLQRVRLSSVAEREIGRLRRANLPGRGRARERDGANHFAERHAAFDGWPAAWPVSNQYRQISASSFAPMRMGSREVPHAGGQAIPRRRLPRSETPARTGASRGCVAKSRPLLPPFRYVSVVPLTGDLEFNSSPKEQSVKRITLRKIFRRPGSMTPHAAIRPLLGRKYSEAGRCSIFARPVNMHLGSKRRTLARSNCGGSSFNSGFRPLGGFGHLGASGRAVQRSRDDHYIAVTGAAALPAGNYTVRFTLDRDRWTATAPGDPEQHDHDSWATSLGW